MKNNAMERDAADNDGDGKLDFNEFCQFVATARLGRSAQEEELKRKRFDALDDDKSGKIDMHEYLQFSLKDALMRSSSRVVDLFRAWDEDKSGTVDKKEFYKAVRSLGFDVDQKDAYAVFDSLDDDKSGALEYKELNEMLRKGVGSEGTGRDAQADAVEAEGYWPQRKADGEEPECQLPGGPRVRPAANGQARRQIGSKHPGAAPQRFGG